MAKVRKKRPLWKYVIGVIVALIIVNYLALLIDGSSRVEFSAGFLLGMLAMYIAVHLYSWK